MRFIKDNIWTLVAVIFAVSFAMIGDACAQGTGQSVMTHATTKLVSVFKSVKTIVFILGGFGLITVAFLAIFGKVNWKWFAGLAVGLAVVAAANAVINYSTGEGLAGNRLSDTFQQGIGYQ